MLEKHILLVLIIALAPVSATAHGGGLDSYGCHHDNRDFKKDYHCHRGPNAGERFSSKAIMLQTRPAPSKGIAEEPADVPTYHGKVVGITDGDTLTLLTEGNRQIKIRLSDIDTPERGQAFGKRATQALAELAYREDARIVYVDTDRYGRMVGRVYVDGVDVNRQLVAEGFAWVFRRYSDDAELLALESQARKKKIGLWADPNPIPPWEWRRGSR